MLKPRYFYSEPAAIATAKVILDADGSIIGLADETTAKVTRRLPRTTICGIFDDEKKTLSFGYAKCSHKDIFNKSLGRKISYNRAIKNPLCTITVDALDNLSDLFMETATMLEEKINFSSSPYVVEGVK